MSRFKRFVLPSLTCLLLLTALLSAIANSVQAKEDSQSTAVTVVKLAPGEIGFLTGPQEGKPAEIALNFLRQHSDMFNLTASDVADVTITDQYTSQDTGVTHVYFVQRLNGIEVFNGVFNVNVMPDGRILNPGNRFVSGLSQKALGTVPSLTAVQATEKAANYLRLPLTTSLQIVESKEGAAQEVVLSDGGISQNPIPAKLVYDVSTNGDVRLAWNVIIYQKDSTHWWNIRIDAATGEFLSKNDWVVQENWNAHGQAVVQSEANSSAPSAFVPAGPTPAPDGSSYKVYQIPVESPNHSVPPSPADGRTTQNQPADLVSNPFGWHDTNGATGAESTLTIGNNVQAYLDLNNDDNPSIPTDFPADGGAGLDFIFTIDLTQAPSAYRPAAVTNLFYWNNLMHDVNYRYGFDEVAGNFQENNYGHGALGSDSVNAEAQDGGGTNNANFGTPPDGQNPTMQMYLWTTTTPGRDGDLDNGIITHEYGHGVSNRLTGGPSNVNCLNNAEQMGEGWSDWQSIIFTMRNGDTATMPRGVGTYALGQPTNGPGIRPAPYTTDMNVNGFTYGDIPSQAVPHGVGFVWATMLWEMNWGLIDAYGFNQDLYRPVGGSWTALSGNQLAHQLVMDGMKLQPCSPGFVDGRNAILAADVALTGGANQCIIWEAFAKRGLGFSASQGSSNSTTDGTEAFDMPNSCLFFDVQPASVDICAGNTATYNIGVGQAFSGPTTLSASGQPSGSTATYVPNPVNAPGSSVLTIGNTTGAAPGHYTIQITGVDNAPTTSSTTADLHVYNATPGSVTLSAPTDGDTNITLVPTYQWSGATQGATYFIEVATDSGFSNVVYTATATGTSHTAIAPLDPLTTYYWHVRAGNPCSNGTFSSTFSFTTADIPPILLVDDDNNSPDVLGYYTTALNNNGLVYDIWDTANSDNEPDAATLAQYDMVIWFTGVAFGGTAGPGGTGEAALSSYLDGSGCFFISSQDYIYDRGITPFIDTYLGVSSATSDVGQTTVTGAGSIFGGMGPYSLSYPFSNFSDLVSPDGPPAELAFAGDAGDAAVNTANSIFWGFPFEAVSNQTDRDALMFTAVNWCGAGGPTGTLSGHIEDGDLNLPIAGAMVQADDGNFVRTAVTNNSGDYSLRLAIGSYDVTASATNYLPVSVNNIDIITDTTTTQDFSLHGALLSYGPDSIEEFMSIGDVVTNTVTVTNTGANTMTYDVHIGNYVSPFGDGIKLVPLSVTPLTNNHPATATAAQANTPFAASGTAVPATSHQPAQPLGGISLVLDDGSREDALGLTSGGQFIWLNRFTPDPADYPFSLTNIQILFGSGVGINVGELVDIYVYEDPDGDGDPGTNATFLGSYTNAAVQATDDVTWSEYTLEAPIVLNGPSGDVLIAVVNRTAGINPGTFVASIDTTSTAGRSWIGLYNGTPADPPTLPADNLWGVVDTFGFPGNWMVRGLGTAGILHSWATAVPNQGTVPPHSVATFEVVFDARSLYQVGDYTADLYFTGSFVNMVDTMPLTMHIDCPTCGFLDGSLFDANTSAPVDGNVHVTGGPGNTDFTVSGETYAVAVPAGSYTLTASASGYISQTAVVTATTGVTVTTDFNLRADAAFISITPPALEVTITLGTSTTLPITLTNAGAGDSTFRVTEKPAPVPPVPGAILHPQARTFSTNLAAQAGPMSVLNSTARETLAEQLLTPQAWSQGASMPSGAGVVRYAHTQCADDADSFYVISGVDESFTVTANAWRYDADTDTWNALAPFPSAAEGPAATCYDGYIYVVGGSPGSPSNQFYIYDIANDSWTPGAALPRVVWGPAMGAWDGQVYVAGGDDDFSFGGTSSEVNIYDIASDTWAGTGSSMPTATGTAGSAQAGQYIYVVGGWGQNAPASNVNVTQRYDMSSDTWEVGPTFDLATSDLALAISDQMLYAIAGDADGGGAFDASTTVDVLDHTTWPAGSWADLGDPLPGARTANNGGYCTTDGNGSRVWSVAGIDLGFVISGLPDYQAVDGCFAGASNDIKWLSENPTEGVVAGDSSEEVAVTFTAIPTLTLGTYTGTLRIATQSEGTPNFLVPVTMNIVTAGMEMHAVSTALSGLPGETVTYTIWMTNSGSIMDTFSMDMSGNIWSMTPSAISMTLPAGGTGWMTIAVHIPATAVDGDMDTLHVVATSANNPSLSATADLVTTAVATYGVDLSPDDAMTGTIGMTVTYSIWITNTGDVTDTFDLTANGIWTPTLSMSSMTLAAGESASITVWVYVPNSANDGDTDVATVTAVSQSDNAVSDTTDLTTTAQSAGPITYFIYLPFTTKQP